MVKKKQKNNIITFPFLQSLKYVHGHLKKQNIKLLLFFEYWTFLYCSFYSYCSLSSLLLFILPLCIVIAHSTIAIAKSLTLLFFIALKSNGWKSDNYMGSNIEKKP